jgi:hypothetical protein
MPANYPHPALHAIPSASRPLPRGEGVRVRFRFSALWPHFFAKSPWIQPSAPD